VVVVLMVDLTVVVINLLVVCVIYAVIVVGLVSVAVVDVVSVVGTVVVETTLSVSVNRRVSVWVTGLMKAPAPNPATRPAARRAANIMTRELMNQYYDADINFFNRELGLALEVFMEFINYQPSPLLQKVFVVFCF